MGGASNVNVRARWVVEPKSALHCSLWMLSHCQECWLPLNGGVGDAAVEVRACQRIGCRPI